MSDRGIARGSVPRGWRPSGSGKNPGFGDRFRRPSALLPPQGARMAPDAGHIRARDLVTEFLHPRRSFAPWCGSCFDVSLQGCSLHPLLLDPRYWRGRLEAMQQVPRPPAGVPAAGPDSRWRRGLRALGALPRRPAAPRPPGPHTIRALLAAPRGPARVGTRRRSSSPTRSRPRAPCRLPPRTGRPTRWPVLLVPTPASTGSGCSRARCRWSSPASRPEVGGSGARSRPGRRRLSPSGGARDPPHRAARRRDGRAAGRAGDRPSAVRRGLGGLTLRPVGASTGGGPTSRDRRKGKTGSVPGGKDLAWWQALDLRGADLRSGSRARGSQPEDPSMRSPFAGAFASSCPVRRAHSAALALALIGFSSPRHRGHRSGQAPDPRGAERRRLRRRRSGLGRIPGRARAGWFVAEPGGDRSGRPRSR